MAESAPFFDPRLAQLQRQLAMQLATQTADLNLQDERLVQDANLMRPYMKRRFGRQMDQAAGNVAGRGFHGSDSGIMRGKLGEVGEDQAFESGMFERRLTREREDIQRSIANLTNQATVEGAEGVRAGAGRAAQRVASGLPF